MKRTLEQLAREVLNADAFVRDVVGIAEVYAAEHQRDRVRSRATDMRRALTQLSKHALSAAEWLDNGGAGCVGRDGKVQHEAWRHLRTVAVGELGAFLRIDSADHSSEIRTIGQAAARAAGQISDKSLRVAPRFAADMLCAVFREHELKPTAYEIGPAVQLLVAVAARAGDKLTRRAARVRIADALRPHHFVKNPPASKRRRRA